MCVTYQAETERLQCVCVEPLHPLQGDGDVAILNGSVGFIRPILGAFDLKPHFDIIIWQITSTVKFRTALVTFNMLL